MTDMETSKRKLEDQVRQENKQVVELEWKYTPNPVEIALYIDNKNAEVPPALPPNATYCLSDSYQGTFYYSGPFETANRENYSLWNRGFYQTLTERYVYKDLKLKEQYSKMTVTAKEKIGDREVFVIDALSLENKTGKTIL